jgi:hypothetical protein
MGLSIRAYARARGVSHVAVLKAIKAGRIPIEPDGAIDPGKADAAWERSTDPGRTKSRTKPSPENLKPVSEAAMGSVRETLKEQGLPASGPFDRGSAFVQARTAHEIAKAHLARLRLQRMKGDLVDCARAAALVFRLAREERDTWSNWPARVAALMAHRRSPDAEGTRNACPRPSRRACRGRPRSPVIAKTSSSPLMAGMRSGSLGGTASPQTHPCRCRNGRTAIVS